jgi:hypothetical protein
MEVAPAIGGALMKATGTQAFNIIQNNGKIAGQEGTLITESQPTLNALLTSTWSKQCSTCISTSSRDPLATPFGLLVQVASSIAGQP